MASLKIKTTFNALARVQQAHLDNTLNNLIARIDKAIMGMCIGQKQYRFRETNHRRTFHTKRYGTHITSVPAYDRSLLICIVSGLDPFI